MGCFGCLGYVMAILLSGAIVFFTMGLATPLVIFWWWASTHDPYPNPPKDGSDDRRKK